ncbi:MAG: hypothetical protein NDJ89_13765 [Oligoflexia bacterium]|nr:hypothetical protein [Oligoflexia bacterium]
MGIENQLVLDHFYISLDAESFDSLLPLTAGLKNAVHSKVQTDNGSWEGIYIKCRTGCYFEILKERRPGGLGIAISPIYPHYVDAAKICERYPALPWRSGTRRLPDGQPWFDWLTLGDYLNIEDTFFNSWLMKYHLSHRDNRPEVARCTIDRYCRLELRLGIENLEALKQLGAWLPGRQRLSETKYLLELPDRDGNDLQIAINLIPGASRFKFLSIDMELSRGEAVPKMELGRFKAHGTKQGRLRLETREVTPNSL